MKVRVEAVRELAVVLASTTPAHHHHPEAEGWQWCQTCLRACARGDAGSRKQAVASAILEESARVMEAE